jgi:hypothetical protein
MTKRTRPAASRLGRRKRLPGNFGGGRRVRVAISAAPRGGGETSPEIVCLTKTDGPLTEEIRLENGALRSDGSACVMTRGVARRAPSRARGSSVPRSAGCARTRRSRSGPRVFRPPRMRDVGPGHTNWFREVGAITHKIADGSGLANLIQRNLSRYDS